MDAFFGKFGSVTSSMVTPTKEDATKAFGFVNYAAPEEASAAIEQANGAEFNGKKLFVSRAQKKEEREKELRDRFEQLKQERQKKYAGGPTLSLHATAARGISFFCCSADMLLCRSFVQSTCT